MFFTLVYRCFSIKGIKTRPVITQENIASNKILYEIVDREERIEEIDGVERYRCYNYYKFGASYDWETAAHDLGTDEKTLKEENKDQRFLTIFLVLKYPSNVGKLTLRHRCDCNRINMDKYTDGLSRNYKSLALSMCYMNNIIEPNQQKCEDLIQSLIGKGLIKENGGGKCTKELITNSSLSIMEGEKCKTSFKSLDRYQLVRKHLKYLYDNYVVQEESTKLYDPNYITPFGYKDGDECWVIAKQ